MAPLPGLQRFWLRSGAGPKTVTAAGGRTPGATDARWALRVNALRGLDLHTTQGDNAAGLEDSGLAGQEGALRKCDSARCYDQYQYRDHGAPVGAHFIVQAASGSGCAVDDDAVPACEVLDVDDVYVGGPLLRQADHDPSVFVPA